MSKTLTPLYDQVTIKPTERNDSTFQIIEDPSKTPSPVMGIVTAVGCGRITLSGSLVPLQVKEGDEVFYYPSDVAVINFQGKEYHIVTDANIIAVVTDSE